MHQSVLDIQQQIKQGLTSQHIIAIINQLGGWVAEHIQKMDKALGAYLSSALSRGRSTRSSSVLGTEIPDRRMGLSGETAGAGTGTCGHVDDCAIMFERFQDPESKSFWKTRYCLTRGGMDCQRRRMIDAGTGPFQIPITMLPNGDQLKFLGD